MDVEINVMGGPDPLDDSESEVDTPPGEFEPQLGGNINNIVYLLKVPKPKSWPELVGQDLTIKIRQHFHRVNAFNYDKTPRFCLTQLGEEGRPGFRFRYMNHTSVATLIRWLQCVPEGMKHDYAQPKFINDTPDGHWAYAVDKNLAASSFLMDIDHDEMQQLMFNFMGKGSRKGQMCYTSDIGVTLFEQDGADMVKFTKFLSCQSSKVICSRKYNNAKYGMNENGQPVVTGLHDDAPEFALTQVRKQSRLPGNEGHVAHIFTLRRLILIDDGRQARDHRDLQYRLGDPDIYLLTFQSFADSPYILQAPRTSLETKNEYLVRIQMQQAGEAYVSGSSRFDEEQDPGAYLSPNQRYYWKSRPAGPVKRGRRQPGVNAMTYNMDEEAEDYEGLEVIDAIDGLDQYSYDPNQNAYQLIPAESVGQAQAHHHRRRLKHQPTDADDEALIEEQLRQQQQQLGQRRTEMDDIERDVDVDDEQQPTSSTIRTDQTTVSSVRLLPTTVIVPSTPVDRLPARRVRVVKTRAPVVRSSEKTSKSKKANGIPSDVVSAAEEADNEEDPDFVPNEEVVETEPATRRPKVVTRTYRSIEVNPQPAESSTPPSESPSSPSKLRSTRSTRRSTEVVDDTNTTETSTTVKSKSTTSPSRSGKKIQSDGTPTVSTSTACSVKSHFGRDIARPTLRIEEDAETSNMRSRKPVAEDENVPEVSAPKPKSAGKRRGRPRKVVVEECTVAPTTSSTVDPIDNEVENDSDEDVTAAVVSTASGKKKGRNSTSLPSPPRLTFKSVPPPSAERTSRRLAVKREQHNDEYEQFQQQIHTQHSKPKTLLVFGDEDDEDDEFDTKPKILRRPKIELPDLEAADVDVDEIEAVVHYQAVMTNEGDGEDASALSEFVEATEENGQLVNKWNNFGLNTVSRKKNRMIAQENRLRNRPVKRERQPKLVFDDSDTDDDDDTQYDGAIESIAGLAETPVERVYHDIKGDELRQRVQHHIRRVNADGYKKVPRFFITDFDGRPGFRFGDLTLTSVATLIRWMQLRPDVRQQHAQPQFLLNAPYGNWAYAVDKTLLAAHLERAVHNNEMITYMSRSVGGGHQYDQGLNATETGVMLFKAEDKRMVRMSKFLSMQARRNVLDRRRTTVFGTDSRNRKIVVGASVFADFALLQTRKQSNVPGNEGHVFHVFSLRPLTVDEYDESTREYSYLLGDADVYICTFQQFTDKPYLLRTKIKPANRPNVSRNGRKIGRPRRDPDAPDPKYRDRRVARLAKLRAQRQRQRGQMEQEQLHHDEVEEEDEMMDGEDAQIFVDEMQTHEEMVMVDDDELVEHDAIHPHEHIQWHHQPETEQVIVHEQHVDGQPRYVTAEWDAEHNCYIVAGESHVVVSDSEPSPLQHQRKRRRRHL